MQPMQQQPADEPLPAILEEILTASKPPEPTKVEPQEEPPQSAPPATVKIPLVVTAEDVRILIELRTFQSLVVAGFDERELQELEDVDPFVQDLSDDPLAMLDLCTLEDFQLPP